MTSLKRAQSEAVSTTVQSSRTVVTCLLSSGCMALWPEMQDPSCYI